MARRKKLEVVKERPIEEVIGESILHRTDPFTTDDSEECVDPQCEEDDEEEESLVEQKESSMSDDEKGIEAAETSIGENIVEDFSKEVENEILSVTKESIKVKEPKVTPKVSPYMKALEIMKKTSKKNKFSNSIVAFMWNGQEFD